MSQISRNLVCHVMKFGFCPRSNEDPLKGHTYRPMGSRCPKDYPRPSNPTPGAASQHNDSRRCRVTCLAYDRASVLSTQRATAGGGLGRPRGERTGVQSGRGGWREGGRWRKGRLPAGRAGGSGNGQTADLARGGRRPAAPPPARPPSAGTTCEGNEPRLR